MEFLNRDPACGETPIKEEEMGFVVKEEEAEKNVFKEEEGEEAIGDSVLPKVIQMDPDAEVLLIDSESDDEDLITTKKANSDSEMERSLSESDEEEDLLVQRASVLPTTEPSPTASPSGRYYTRRSAPSSHLPAPHTSARRSSTPLSQSSDSDPDFEESPSKRRPAPQPIPKSKRARGGSATSRLNEEGAWHNREDTDEEPEPLQFKPRRPPGPTIDRTRTWSPLSLFQLFFSKSVIHTLINNTNVNAARRIAEGVSFKWENLDVKSFFTFLAFIIWSGLVKTSCRQDYWAKKFYNFKFPQNRITRQRFESIMWFLHLSDPREDEINERKRGKADYDRLFKIKPLYTEMVASCKAHFQPYQNIAIDERMVKSKARTLMKVHMRDKPVKWGFKLFVLADSKTSYTWNFSVYEGKKDSGETMGLSYTSVMNLLPLSLLGKGYSLFVDNFYTSPTLFKELSTKNIGCCGTIRQNRQGYPKKAGNKLHKNAEKGDIRWLRKDNLLFVQWMDTCEVNMCSTMHKAYSGKTVNRRVKQGAQWQRKDIPVPDSIMAYNQHMGGVDVSDALIGYYSVLHKTMKWYKTFLYHFLDIAVVNSFILHRDLCSLGGERPLTQKQFREKLWEEMLEFSGEAPPPRPAGAPHPGTCMPMYHPKDLTKRTKVRKICEQPECRKKTQIFCRKCKKNLCLTVERNCFQEWHDKQN